ncbi:unnamed protein product [Durusdinium trenchii]|uniref:Uncharacterized protein n=1 Tax=Durusdinium trenchii TaxID=1381693 RepID=A0ABP0MGL1_9DINO
MKDCTACKLAASSAPEKAEEEEGPSSLSLSSLPILPEGLPVKTASSLKEVAENALCELTTGSVGADEDVEHVEEHSSRASAAGTRSLSPPSLPMSVDEGLPAKTASSLKDFTVENARRELTDGSDGRVAAHEDVAGGRSRSGSSSSSCGLEDEVSALGRAECQELQDSIKQMKLEAEALRLQMARVEDERDAALAHAAAAEEEACRRSAKQQRVIEEVQKCEAFLQGEAEQQREELRDTQAHVRRLQKELAAALSEASAAKELREALETAEAEMAAQNCVAPGSEPVHAPLGTKDCKQFHCSRSLLHWRDAFRLHLRSQLRDDLRRADVRRHGSRAELALGRGLRQLRLAPSPSPSAPCAHEPRAERRSERAEVGSVSPAIERRPVRSQSVPVLRGGGRVRAAAQSVPVPPTAPGGCGVPSLASSLAVAGQPRAVRSEEKQVAAPWDAGRVQSPEWVQTEALIFEVCKHRLAFSVLLAFLPAAMGSDSASTQAPSTTVLKVSVTCRRVEQRQNIIEINTTSHMGWASSAQAQEASRSALEAARRELMRLRGINHASEVKSTSVAAANEAARLQVLLKSVETEESSGDPSSDDSFELVESNSLSAGSLSSWKDLGEPTGAPTTGTGAIEETSRRRGKKSGRTRQRAAKWRKEVRIRTPSPDFYHVSFKTQVEATRQ